MTSVGDRCYCCGGPLNDDDMCRHCGAQRQINKSTGNVIWVRRGKLVAAFDDERESYRAMAKANDIPYDRWTEKYK